MRIAAGGASSSGIAHVAARPTTATAITWKTDGHERTRRSSPRLGQHAEGQPEAFLARERQGTAQPPGTVSFLCLRRRSGLNRTDAAWAPALRPRLQHRPTRPTSARSWNSHRWGQLLPLSQQRHCWGMEGIGPNGNGSGTRAGPTFARTSSSRAASGTADARTSTATTGSYRRRSSPPSSRTERGDRPRPTPTAVAADPRPPLTTVKEEQPAAKPRWPILKKI